MVSSRALSLAAVTLLVGCCAMGRVEAQENLEAGKSPSQIFSGTCTACHKTARGLLKTVAPGSLQGFLRQHYTTSPEMAGVLASYLMSNGATDTRYGDKQKGAKAGKDGKEAKSEAKPEAGAAPGEAEHAGRAAKRMAHPAKSPEAGKPAAEGQQGASEHGPDGRKTKRRLSKRGKPDAEEETAPRGAETPAEPAKEEATGGEPAKNDTAKVKSARPESARPEESAKPADSAKPVESAKPAENANADAAKGKVNEALPPSLRPDPVPPVTPAATAAPVTAAVPPPPPAEPASPPAPPLSH